MARVCEAKRERATGERGLIKEGEARDSEGD